MKKLILGFALLFAVVAPQPAISETENLLNETVPKQYRVVEGDTLWDISDLFLRDPWMWPEIWHANQQIANSHLIYPDDLIVSLELKGLITNDSGFYRRLL